MISMPAKTQSPSARLCHNGRCVVSALRTGNRNSSADAAHNCSTQADLAGRTRACSSVRSPDDEERVDLPVSAALQRVRQEAVGPQECSHCDRQAGDARNVQSLYKAEAKIGTIRVRQLLSPLYGPHDQARAHHGRTHEADEKVQPSHFGVAEAPQVERIKHAAGFGRSPHIVTDRRAVCRWLPSNSMYCGLMETRPASPRATTHALPHLRDERRSRALHYLGPSVPGPAAPCPPPMPAALSVRWVCPAG